MAPNVTTHNHANTAPPILRRFMFRSSVHTILERRKRFVSFWGVNVVLKIRQNVSRALNCSSLPGPAASVMVPNCGVFTKRFGVPKLERFSVLNDSNRNRNRHPSLMGNSPHHPSTPLCLPTPHALLNPSCASVSLLLRRPLDRQNGEEKSGAFVRLFAQV